MNEIPLTDSQNEEPNDRSHIWWAVILGLVILVMAWLTLFVDDPWKFFRKSGTPATVSVKEDTGLDNQATLSDEEMRKSLVRFIEAFYFDQRRGYFDPPSYFAPITETFYNFHNLTYQRLKEVYWKRRADMEHLEYSWNPTSLEFNRDSARLVVSYWASEQYFRPSRHSKQSADVRYELMLDENGKIVSLRELEVSNFVSSGFSEAAVDSVDSAKTVSSGVPVRPGNVSATAAPPVPEPENTDQKIYELGTVDAPPEYPGGQKELAKYLNKNLRYPSSARFNNVEGKVFVGFIIEKNGTISGVNVLRGIGSGCDEEAVRVIRSLPAFKPAEVGGKPVRNAYVLSVSFKLTE